MVKTETGLANGILDAADQRQFHTHVDILEQCFGVHYKAHMKGTWSPKNTEDWFVWFPKCLKDKDGAAKASSSGWTNSLSMDGKTIKEWRDDDAEDFLWDLGKLGDEERLVFVYDSISQNYTFCGAFVCNKSETKRDHHVYSRIASKVKLIGNPVYAYELIDKDV